MPVYQSKIISIFSIEFKIQLSDGGKHVIVTHKKLIRLYIRKYSNHYDISKRRFHVEIMERQFQERLKSSSYCVLITSWDYNGSEENPTMVRRTITISIRCGRHIPGIFSRGGGVGVYFRLGIIQILLRLF